MPRNLSVPTERSRSPSRARSSRAPSPSRLLFIPQSESLILPDGAVDGEEAELLTDFVHHHYHDGEPTLIDSLSGIEEGASSHKVDNLRWWKKPAPWWLLIGIPLSAISMSSTIAPRIEIYTYLACQVHKPEYSSHVDLRHLGYPFYRPDREIFQPPPPITLPMPPISNFTSAYISEQNILVATKPGDENLCASDPVVQAAVAKLSAVMATSMGILSCMTVGWWGSFSDRYGRTIVLGVALLGLLYTDINFILVSLFSRNIPGGYWFLLVGPLIDGCLGGMSAMTAANQAYIADCTEPGARARIFSLSLGLLFTGMAFGPSLGGILIRVTGQVLSVFYSAAILHFSYAVFVWTIVPESLSKDRMITSRAQHKQAQIDSQARTTGFSGRLARYFTFLSPLSIFYPEYIDDGGNPLKAKKRDWNLTLVAGAYGSMLLLMGSYTYKFQYAQAAFGWTAETLGYWLSLVGATRAIFLTIILPVAIKLVRSKPKIELPQESSEPLHNTSNSVGSSVPSSDSLVEEVPPTKPLPVKRPHSPLFDLRLAQVSTGIDLIAYTFLALAATPFTFLVSGTLGSFGAGFSPAVQSVAVDLYTRRGGTESGKLFGAMSVVGALCSSIIGPSLFGFTYVQTVEIFPKAIFFLSVVAVIISFTLLSCVRLPKEPQHSNAALKDVEENVSDHVQNLHREDTLVDDS